VTGAGDRCPPTDQEAREMLEIARLGALGCGATGPDVDDIAQTVAEKLTWTWSDPNVVAARARGRKGWHAYIVVTARNAHRDQLRTRDREHRRQVRYARQTDGEALPDRPGVRRRHPSPRSDVDRYLARLLLVDLVTECPLTARQREVGMLALVDGLTTAEIAGKLGITVHAVNSHRRSVVRIMRDELLSRAAGDPAGSGERAAPRA
jgi:RNA polymerase sigma factor (sigma-70 family)